MEEEVNNADELELLGLIDSLLKLFRNGNYADEESKKKGEDFIVQYQALKNEITGFAQSRNIGLKEMENEEKNRINFYYDDQCSHCGYDSNFKPIGEQKGEEGYTFYTYKCPKCRKNFKAKLPVDDHEAMTWYENYIDLRTKKPDHVNPLSKRRNMTKTESDKMIEGFNIFKDKVLADDKVKAELKNLNDRYNERIKEHIVSLISYKNNIIKNNS